MPNPTKSWRRFFNWGALVGVLLTIFAARILAYGLLADKPFGARIISLSYDLLFTRKMTVPGNEVLMVYMDEESHRQLGQSAHQAWSRQLHAGLIRRLTQEGAKVIALDSTFFQKSDNRDDTELAEAMKAHGKVVIASYLEESDAGKGGSLVVSLRDSPPFRKVAHQGVANTEIDPGYFVRRAFKIPPDSGIDATTYPEKIAEVSGYVVSQKSREAQWLNYYGPAMHLPWTSYYLAYTNGTTPGAFKDKVVFIGLLTAAGLPFDQRDAFETPYSVWRGNPMSGVEIHATRFLNLIHGTGLHRLSPSVEAMLIGVLGVAFGWGLILVRPVFALLIAVAGASALAALSFLLFKANVWWPWMIPVAVQIPVALMWAVTFNTVRLKIESKTLERSLALHLSPKRAKQIANSPELLALGAEKHEISILFSDIANFSTITARMHPADLFKLLNSYFESSLACVHKTDGTVVKLIGDAIFAIWNAPFPQENHARLAVQTALAMRDQLIRFDAAQHSLPLQTRIGLHLGDAFVGNVGSRERFDYTAIGDNINLASRLEGLNKFLGTTVLGTRDIQRLVENDFSSRLLGHFIFKGIDRAVEVHEFIGPTSDQPPWKATFAEALFNFQRRNFEAAATGFRKTIQARGADGPSEFYLAQIDKLAKSDLPESWAGEIRLSDK